MQRPLIADMMREDFVLLKKLAGMVNTVGEADSDGEQMIDLLSVIEELEKVENEELDFRVEAENTRFFKENCIDDEEKITCPTVIDELTTERLFTMTFVDGYSIAKRDRLIEEGYDPEQIGSVILDNYIHQVLDVGTFHGDPHQGNIMVSHGKPVWIDFGMIGRITDQDVNIIQSLIMSLIERDLDALVNAIMSMGAASPKTDRNKLVQDADMMFDKYMNVTNLDELDLAALLTEITDLASKHHISLPGKYTMLVRSIATIEGVIEQLCPELNLFKQITDKLLERLKKNLDVGQEGAAHARPGLRRAEQRGEGQAEAELRADRLRGDTQEPGGYRKEHCAGAFCLRAVCGFGHTVYGGHLSQDAGRTAAGRRGRPGVFRCAGDIYGKAHVEEEIGIPRNDSVPDVSVASMVAQGPP